MKEVQKEKKQIYIYIENVSQEQKLRMCQFTEGKKMAHIINQHMKDMAVTARLDQLIAQTG